MKRYAAAALAAFLALAGTNADAATLQFTALPVASAKNPLAVSTSGDVRQNLTRDYGHFENPWTPGKVYKAHAYPTAYYTGVGKGGSATYRFDLANAASFVWGSPDFYNKVEFLRGARVVDSYQLGPRVRLAPASRGQSAAMATFSDIIGGVFDGIRFSSLDYSFEFSNFTTTPAPVPLPAGGALMLTAVGGLALARKRRRKAA